MRRMSDPTTAESLSKLRAARDSIAELGQETRVDLGNGTYQWWSGANFDELCKEIKRLEGVLAREQMRASGAPTIGGLSFSRARMDGGY